MRKNIKKSITLWGQFLQRKIKLPYYMGSLNKLKNEQDVNKWSKSYPGNYIIEDKVDGLSLLFVSRIIGERRINKLYTRGGGTEGKDVSHILDYMEMPYSRK